MTLDVSARDSLQTELRRLFHKSKMPTSPALAAQILSLIDCPESSAADFGTVLSADPALATRLLQTANAAHFAQRHPVSTIERAVTVLGLNRVKTVSLGFQLVAHLDRLGNASFDMSLFWQHSLLRACLARIIAQRTIPERQEEAFLVGLLQECGVVLLVQIFGSSYATLYGRNLSPAAFFAMERNDFRFTHVDAIAALAVEWSLPDIMGEPLARHHERTTLTESSTEVDRLAAVSYLVGGLCFVASRKITVEAGELREYGEQTLGLNEQAWIDVDNATATEYHRLAALYGDFIANEIDVVNLLDEAKAQLAHVVTEADRRLVDAETERECIRLEQHRLANALRDYRERAALDPLTSAVNRGALTEAAGHAILCDRDVDVPICVIFLDIDDFKLVNDQFGHAAGDLVLKEIALLLDRLVGGAGVVGRYGGEEFVVILRGQDEEECRAIATNVTEGVRDLQGRRADLPCKITCSVGAFWCDRVPASNADGLFSRADRLMYRAKREGKDRLCFEVIDAPRAEGSTNSRALCLNAKMINPMPSLLESFDRNEYIQLVFLAKQLNQTDNFDAFNVRKQPRKKAIVPCVFRCFTGGESALAFRQAVTRNITKGGVGLVAACPLQRSEAIEIAVDQVKSRRFFAGLVTFCRPIEGVYNDIGMQFIRSSLSPILEGDMAQALRDNQWLARAIHARSAPAGCR